MKTAELVGPALDWAVAKCERYVIEWDDVFEDYWLEHGDVRHTRLGNYSPSTSWEQAGPLIEREEISIKYVVPAMRDSVWQAFPSITAKGAGGRWGVGPTPLIAAMRCYVASKLGDEIEIPEELK